MASVLDLVKHYQSTIEKYPHDEQKILKCIDKLFHLDVTVQHLQDTGVGRTVNALRKEPGDVGQAARSLVYKWKLMVAAEESDAEEHNNEMSSYNGHGSGKESDDNCQRSDQNHKANATSRINDDKEEDESYSSTKRKYHSSEEEDTHKRRKHSSTSEDDNQNEDRKEESDSESNDNSDISHSYDSDSEMSESSHEEVKVKQEIKKEHSSSRKSSSNKHSSHSDHSDHKSSNSKKSHESNRHSKHHNSQASHMSSEKPSSKEKSHSTKKHSSHNSEKSSSSNKNSNHHSEKHSHNSEKHNSHSSDRHKSSKDKESSSDKKQKSDSEKKHKESKSKHSSSSNEKYKSSSSHKTDSSSDKQKTSSDKHKSDKHKSSSQSHGSGKDKHKSSLEKETSRHKSKESTSNGTGSVEKHTSSSKDKSKERSSSKDKSSSEKKHSLREHKSSPSNSGKDKSEKKSDKKSSHKTSSTHKSSKSSTTISKKEDLPKKKVQINERTNSDDGIDCGSGASFAEALGMISPAKPKKKSSSYHSKDTTSPNSDMSPAALLAPSAKLAPLPALEICALPEISPNYKPRPPPRPLPHFNEEEAMSHVISSKNQRTKVYSGNKILGKVPSLYEMCVNILQEHIDALEFTGGVPYEILKPVVDKATPRQLYVLEHYNNYLMEDTDHLWKNFCQKHFRNKQRQEMETWREMYTRCEEEQEHRLKSLTANIKIAQEAKKAPIKQTKMAYVDSVAKPPRNIAKKQAAHGTARIATGSPAARVAALATAPNVLRGGAGVRAMPAPSNALPSSFKPKKAPLMAKALQIMRGRKR